MLLRAGAPASVLGAACGQLRCLSTGAQSVTGEMITYARENFKGAHDQALDIVKSGLSYMTTGPEAGRLYLAQAEVEADRSRWPEVADLARLAATAASEAAPTTHEENVLVGQVELFASCVATRAHLVKARSAEAFSSAQTCMEVARKSFSHKDQEEQRWQGLVLASSTVGLVQHAASDFDVAAESFEDALSRADQPPSTPPADGSTSLAPAGAAAAPSTPAGTSTADGQSASPIATTAPAEAAAGGPGSSPSNGRSGDGLSSVGGGQQQQQSKDHLIAPALKQAALFMLAQANSVAKAEPEPLQRALQLAARAVAGAERAVDEVKSGAGVFQSPVFCGEALVDAHLTDAQLSMHTEDWDAAEAKLTKALAAAEGISSDSHPRVALVLMLLGFAYSRSARVTLAEGLFRECSKMLQLTPTRAEDIELTMVHPSIGALLSWRYCQLLTALPNRGTEAAAWHKMAGCLWEEAPIGRKNAPETVFGGLEYLKGKGDPGMGVVVDLMARRALPRQL
ncbi:hypothetical protein N2152v2_004191 [Parachlorella kessleri]